jgi:glycosyltransferase involved in cell wall biosynthesis
MGDGTTPFLTLVVPAYREALRIEDSIRQVRAFFDRYPFPVEIHYRIEKSPDQTVQLALQAAGDDPRFKIFAHPVQRGKGFAVRQGILAAETPIRLFMDTDISTPLYHIFEFLNFLEKNPHVDIVVGDRKHPQAQIFERQTFYRQITSRVFGLLSRVCMGSSLGDARDTQCGFKAFRESAARQIFSHAQVDGFAFDLEIFVLAEELGFQVVALPVQWKNDERSTVHPIWDPLRMLKTMLMVKREVRARLRELRSRESVSGESLL